MTTREKDIYSELEKFGVRDRDQQDRLIALVEKLVTDQLKPHQISSDKKTSRIGDVEKILGKKDENVATVLRRDFIERTTGVELRHAGTFSIDMNETSHDGLTIGAAQVPIKYVGKVRVNGEYARGEYPVFFAALEGDLAAGAARGIGTFNKAGGVTTVIKKDGMTRDVLVELENIIEAKKLYKWIESDQGQKFLEERFNSKTEHGRFIEAEPYMHGKHVHIVYRASTGASMGMNILTKFGKEVTDEMMEYVSDPKTGFLEKITLLTPSGNMCTDKKPTHKNFLEGRGMSIEAEANLPIELVKERFFKEDITPEEAAYRLVKVNVEKNERGTRLAGSVAANTHVANALAAIYLAYGQDVAQIVEGSLAVIELELTKDRKYVYVHGSFPVIEIGTYRGETMWGTQKELLKATGVYGEGDDKGTTRFRAGEIFVSAALATDVNLTGNQAAGTHGSTRLK